MRARIAIGWLFIFLLCVPVILVAEDAKDKDDFSAYVEQIREWGMTENARMSIGMIASIEAGITLLVFQKDDSSGAFWPRYMAASCPRPDMSEIELKELRDELEAKTAPLLKKMQPIADADKSGFVTTKEGADFRVTVEFGYKASHIVKKEGLDMEQICRGLSMNEEQVRERVKQYKELLAESKAVGLDLPELDI